MNTKYLLLWLEGPLQSWGDNSKFGRRETRNFPTKSAVLGLVCSALGAGGKQIELLAQFALLNMVVVSYKKNNVLPSVILNDFHVVGNGYNQDDSWEKLLSPKTADGKKPTTSGAKVTYRKYLQDAVFAVLLETPLNYINELDSAFKNPVWDLYLGRKCCIPTEIIYQGLFDTLDDIEIKLKELTQTKSLSEYFRILQGDCDGDEIILLNDVPVQFGQEKKYTDRYVTIKYNNLNYE